MQAINTSLPIPVSDDQLGKGFLYKIKNEQDITISYLFGTLHQIEDGLKEPYLHSKVFKSLTKCQNLFVELDFLDEETLVNHYLQQNLSKEKAIKKAKKFILKHTKKPKSIEDVLSLRARMEGISVQNLETEESRQQAKKSIETDFKILQYHNEILNHLDPKFYLSETKKWIEKAVKELDEDNTKLFLQYFEQGFNYLVKVNQLNLEFNPDSDPNFNDKEFQEDYNKVNKCFTEFSDLFNSALNRNLEPSLPELAKLKAKEKLEKKKEKQNQDSQKIYLAWRSGNSDLFPPDTSHNLFKKLLSDLIMKKTSIRDEFIIDRIHNALLTSTKVQRNFFAIGAFHLTGNYENVRVKLEKLGWKIVPSYKSHD